MTSWKIAGDALAMTLLYAVVYGLALIGTAVLEPEVNQSEPVDLVRR
jgi:hypothetical protein